MKLSSTVVLSILLLALCAPPARAGAPIALELGAQPPTVPAGGSTLVTVIARSPETGTLVAGAEVSLRSSGGYFGLTARASKGTTDERGVFRTVWRTESADRYTRDTSYVILVQVTHPGHEPGSGSLPIRVTAEAAPAPSVTTPLVLTIAARPDEVPAGGETEIIAHVSDEDGDPVRDAVLRAAVGGGSFVGAKGVLVTGKTDATGTWRARWRTEVRAAYRASTSYVFLIEAAKEGYGAASGQVEVLVFVATSSPAARPRTMLLSADAQPTRVVAGGTTTVLVTAQSAAGEPIAGARVRVAVGGGSFQSTRSTTATGSTDRAGSFRAKWTTGDASLYRSEMGYEFTVDVEKTGYQSGRTTLVVRVLPVREAAPAAPRQIEVSASTQPDEIPATGSTTVVVRAVTEEGGAVAGATVRVQTGGGQFDGAGGTEAVGTTDAQGRFQAVWRPGDPRLYTQSMEFGFWIRVSKPGSLPGATEASVRVVVGAKPAPPQPTMEVRVTAQPADVDAGGVTTITVAARDTRGAALAGAAVTLRVDGGFFRDVDGLTATGVTDASGVFRIQWRTNNAPTYTREVQHEFRAGVSKQGYPEGTSKGSVRVRPYRVR